MTEDNSLLAQLQRAGQRARLRRRAAAGRAGALSPEGEILIKSPGQFSGYYKQPELTAESFTEDGFFRTGDRGERRADGLLKITGRVKELFKTAKGKYVAPAPIENRAQRAPDGRAVAGVGRRPAGGLCAGGAGRGRCARAWTMPRVRAEVQRELAQLLQQVNRELADYEQLQMIVVAREPWIDRERLA